MSNPKFKSLHPHTSDSRSLNFGFGLANLKGKLRGLFRSINDKETSRSQTQTSEKQIIDEVVEALNMVDGKLFFGLTVALQSWRDTQTDKQTIKMLKDYNEMLKINWVKQKCQYCQGKMTTD